MEEFFFEISCENETRKISISLRAALGLFIICISACLVPGCVCVCVLRGGGVGKSCHDKTYLILHASLCNSPLHSLTITCQSIFYKLFYIYINIYILLLGLRLKVLLLRFEPKNVLYVFLRLCGVVFQFELIVPSRPKKDQNKEVLNPLSPISNL